MPGAVDDAAAMARTPCARAVSTGLSTARLATDAPLGAGAAFADGAFAAFAALSTLVIASVCALVLATARLVVCLIPETFGSDCACAVQPRVVEATASAPASTTRRIRTYAH